MVTGKTMRKIILLLAIACNTAFPVGADKVWRVPASGSSVPAWGPVNLASGSAVTGVLPIANLAASLFSVSSSSGFFSTSSGSLVDVTNMSVTVTVSGSRPVEVAVIPEASTNNCSVIAGGTSTTIAGGTVAFFRDSTRIATMTFGPAGASGNISQIIPCSSFRTIDSPSAGSYTYKVQMLKSAGASVEMNSGRLAIIQTGM